MWWGEREGRRQMRSEVRVRVRAKTYDRDKRTFESNAQIAANASAWRVTWMAGKALKLQTQTEFVPTSVKVRSRWKELRASIDRRREIWNNLREAYKKSSEKRKKSSKNTLLNMNGSPKWSIRLRNHTNELSERLCESEITQSTSAASAKAMLSNKFQRTNSQWRNSSDRLLS